MLKFIEILSVLYLRNPTLILKCYNKETVSSINKSIFLDSFTWNVDIINGTFVFWKKTVTIDLATMKIIHLPKLTNNPELRLILKKEN